MVTESAFERVAKVQKKAGTILTGGALVQILSRGRFLTADIDLVLAPNESEEGAVKALQELGFIKKGAYWLDESGDDLYQLIPEYYYDRTMGARYKGGRLKTVSLEYIIADRLRGCSEGDRGMCEQALFLLEGFGRDVDGGYLRELLRRFEVDESFLHMSKLQRLVRTGRRR